MRYCSVEGDAFPDDEFRRDENGVLLHTPEGEPVGHPAERLNNPEERVEPLPAPADAETDWSA